MVYGAKGYMGSGHFTVHTQGTDVRAGSQMSRGSRPAGCPGWRVPASVTFCEGGPDFRAVGPDVRAL